VIAEWFVAMTLEEALAACEKHQITAGIIATMRDIAENPHVQERGNLVDIIDPVNGKQLRMPGVPARLSGSPGKISYAGLPFGAANSFCGCRYSGGDHRWLAWRVSAQV